MGSGRLIVTNVPAGFVVGRASQGVQHVFEAGQPGCPVFFVFYLNCSLGGGISLLFIAPSRGKW